MTDIKVGDMVVVKQQDTDTGIVGKVLYINAHYAQPWALVHTGCYKVGKFIDEISRCASSLTPGMHVLTRETVAM